MCVETAHTGARSCCKLRDYNVLARVFQRRQREKNRRHGADFRQSSDALRQIAVMELTARLRKWLRKAVLQGAYLFGCAHRIEHAGDDLAGTRARAVIRGFAFEQLRMGKNDPELVV